jgi:acyl-CoA reductase-like NAD-dependent aldehyde dehydrogenase
MASTTFPGRSSFVGTSWLPEHGRTEVRLNPADFGDPLDAVFCAEPADAEAAVHAAAAASGEWGRQSAVTRPQVLARAAALIRERAAEIAAELTREVGKTLGEAQAEVLGGAAILEAIGGGALWCAPGSMVDTHRETTLGYTRRHPLGVVGLITPWNFPFSNPCVKISSALMAGNAVVWKPSPAAPMTAIALTACLTDAGLPPGVLNALIGGDEQVGRALVRDPRVAGVSFTGSTEVGLGLAVELAGRGARAQLELGGKNAIVVLEDADITEAARATATGAFLSAGQKCTSVSRVVLLPGVRDEFREALLEQAARLRVGVPTDPLTDIGPVISERALLRHQSVIEGAVSGGARLLTGGARLTEGLPHGAYLAPAVLDGVSAADPIAQEEVFGPVLVLLDAADHDEAIRIANGTRYGLAASVYTADLSSAFAFAERLEAGVVKVNEPPPGLEPHLPVGGWKASGYGPPELGPSAIEFFTQGKTVYLNHSGARA